MDKLIISLYGSHNAAVSMYYKGQYYVVEVERWLNIKNSGLTGYLPARHPQIVFDEIVNWLLSKTQGEEVDVYLVGYGDGIIPKFSYKEMVRYDHHTAHAAAAFYQSPYDDMLTFTFDGGGDGAFFNVYRTSHKNGVELLATCKKDLGFAYMVIGEILDDIKREDLSIGNLVYAGKLMGLCAYGNVREDWLQFFDDFYSKFEYDGVSYIGGKQVMRDAMETLMKQIGATDYIFGVSRYSEQFAWDIAATSQKAFERTFYKIATPFLDQYRNLPVGLSGGCALNVLLNTKLIFEKNGKVFVPPNTNDCGISVGGLLWYIKPTTPVDLTYSGLPIMDEHMLTNYINKYELSVVDGVSVRELAGYISEGYIVGIIQGNSEHGSRALGNRSIVCSPVGDMKDTINHKVKKREWYRPFAPMVRYEDVNKYFDFNYESRHMTYAANVREEWRTTIPAVTHEDGTGRLQTVTQSQNKLIYDLITEFEKINGFGVLLNTSFNVNGKPILTTLADAIELLKTSNLDAVYFKNKLLFKQNHDIQFKSIRDSNGYNVIPLNRDEISPSICLNFSGENLNKLSKDILSLSKSYDTILLIAHASVVDAITATHNNVKPFRIEDHKIYHLDRLQKYMSVPDMYDRLKYIWLREALESSFKMVKHFIVVDYNDSSDVSKLLDSIKKLESDFYDNVTSIHHDTNTYNTGSGVLITSADNIRAIADMMETSLVNSLYHEESPDPEAVTLKSAIAGRRQP